MAETPCFSEVQVFSGKRIRVRANFLTALSPRIYLASPEKLLPSPRVSTLLSPSDYSRTPFYLYTESLLFT